MSEHELRGGIAGHGIDVVDLILPRFLHYEAATRALNAGKHLLPEKPVALGYADAAVIYQLAAVPRPPRLRRPGRRGRPVRPGRMAPGRPALRCTPCASSRPRVSRFALMRR